LRPTNWSSGSETGLYAVQKKFRATGVEPKLGTPSEVTKLLEARGALINWISIGRFIPVTGYALRFLPGAPSDTPSFDAC
jgi:hypothetical protein